MSARERLNAAVNGASLRKAGLFVAWVAVGVLAALVVTFAGSLLIGHKLIVVGSDSQAPALRDGDVAIERQVNPGDVETGEIITFSEPGTGNQVSHRVQFIEPVGARVRIVTKGDSSDTYERFTVPEDGQVGVVIRRVPLVGHVADAIGGPLALLLLPLAAIGLAAGLEVSRRRLRPGT